MSVPNGPNPPSRGSAGASMLASAGFSPFIDHRERQNSIVNRPLRETLGLSPDPFQLAVARERLS